MARGHPDRDCYQLSTWLEVCSASGVSASQCHGPQPCVITHVYKMFTRGVSLYRRHGLTGYHGSLLLHTDLFLERPGFRTSPLASFSFYSFDSSGILIPFDFFLSVLIEQFIRDIKEEIPSVRESSANATLVLFSPSSSSVVSLYVNFSVFGHLMHHSFILSRKKENHHFIHELLTCES